MYSTSVGRPPDAIVITHDPNKRTYAVLTGWPGVSEKIDRPHFSLRDAVRAADPDDERLWEDPSSAADNELHPDTVLYSISKRAAFRPPRFYVER